MVLITNCLHFAWSQTLHDLATYACTLKYGEHIMYEVSVIVMNKYVQKSKQ